MISFLDVFEKYWYVALIIVVTYILIIIVIEIKDINYFHFNFDKRKHEYKDSKSWSRLNYLFFKEFNYYRNAPLEDIIIRFHNQLKNLILLELKDNDETDKKILLQKFIDNLPENELKFFLHDPLRWLEIKLDQSKRFLLFSFLNKKSTSYKKLLPHVVYIEKILVAELHIDDNDEILNFESEFYDTITNIDTTN